MTCIKAAARIIYTIAALVLCSLTANAFDIQEIKSPGGISAWFVHDETLPLIAINFAFSSGSATDQPGKEGTAHFLTGMMDEGSGELDGPAFQALRDDLGIRISFDASIDRFQGSLQTVSKHRMEAFKLLQSALANPSFPPDAIERMRKSFIVNAKSEENDPQSIVSRALMRSLVGDHPYSRPSRGSPTTIANISRDDLISSHKAIFAKNRLKIAVVGDITSAELGAALDQIFGSLPAEGSTFQVPQAAVSDAPGIKVIDRPMPQSIIMFGTKGLKLKDPGFIPAFVLEQILGGSTGSWLNEEVREKRGLTYGIGFELVPMEHAALMLGSFSTRNEAAGEAMGIVRETIARMAKDGPTQQELDDAKTFLTGSYALRFDSSEKIVGFLLSQQILGRERDYINRRNSLIQAVTLEQVKEQARRLLSEPNFKVVAIGKPEGLK
jgi:zinc protease